MGVDSSDEGVRPVPAWSAVVVLALVVAFQPWLPGGPDLYAHLSWAHQALRCVSSGSLPVWCPDLNAGFGSPGLRLYSPAGPLAAGLLGLPTDDAAAGLRLTLVLMGIGVAFVSRRLRLGRVATVLVLVGPTLVADLFVRAAWSQVLAVPLAWWVLDQSVGGRRFDASWRLAGACLALLWLIHAPTAVMVAPVAIVCVGARRRWRSRFWWWAGATVVAGGALTAWHWLPLVSELRLVAAHRGLTEGIFATGRNYLGSATAHASGLNRAHSLTAVTLLLMILLLRGWKDDGNRCRWLATLACLVLTTWAIVPLVRLGLPLDWLQFPWRWLLPAMLLVVGPVSRRIARGGWVAVVLLALWVAPCVIMPWKALVSVAPVGADDGWVELGGALRELGGNPLAVDVVEHRPPWHDGLTRQLGVFGVDRRVAVPFGVDPQIETWRPLRRRVVVAGPSGGHVKLRLLRYPWWEASVDGEPASVDQGGAVVSVAVPPGRHTVTVRWSGNPLTRVGLVATVVAIVALLWRRSPDAPRSA